ncbi:DUF1116 domain-containing protein [Egibacter rhizosphaerae]|uniref:DUF1116 domain-containing protein n=1 Tax=Egibacter rhizosphaerae TaxID=1670831 RepID=A0A411YCZ7_9ACTN|nr:DUF1116 domain-containing protein [Egibacter rhizosphaerae]QBI19094.1 DUF1116 domain-containing protein [Egibacter rhizosphaerae]
MTRAHAPLGGLLDEAPAVATAGAERFDAALAGQGATSLRAQWRPPVDGTAEALATVAGDPRLSEANAQAVGRLLTSRPHLVGIETARDALDLDDRTLLHAGPPIDWAHASGPMRGAIIGALLYEGVADDPEAAERMAANGEIALEPAHHRGAVGPMAGIVAPSMPVFTLRDEEHGTVARCTLNEGLGKVLRYGAFGDEVTERLQWMERVLGPLLARTLERTGPIDVRALLAQALQMGDEGHNRHRAGTSLFLREFVSDLIEIDAPVADIAAVTRFINANDHFFLNVVMPAAKAATDSARGLAGSSMLVAMARNGTEFGVQLAGTGDTWFTAPASVPDGLYLGEYGPEDANPDIGDSTITESCGIGGFAMAAAPAIVRFVGGEVADALRFTRRMYEITLAESTAYQIPILGFRGTPTGIDATLVCRTGIVPAVNTGIAGKEPGTGQVGAGLVEPPLSCFADAVRELAARAESPVTDPLAGVGAAPGEAP